MVVEELIQAVARSFGVTVEQVCSTARQSANLDRAKHFAYYLVRVHTGMPWEQMGVLFGKRYHSGVRKGVQTAMRHVREDKETELKMRELESSLGLRDSVTELMALSEDEVPRQKTQAEKFDRESIARTEVTG